MTKIDSTQPHLQNGRQMNVYNWCILKANPNSKGPIASVQVSNDVLHCAMSLNVYFWTVISLKTLSISYYIMILNDNINWMVICAR